MKPKATPVVPELFPKQAVPFDSKEFSGSRSKGTPQYAPRQQNAIPPPKETKETGGKK